MNEQKSECKEGWMDERGLRTASNSGKPCLFIFSNKKGSTFPVNQ